MGGEPRKKQAHTPTPVLSEGDATATRRLLSDQPIGSAEDDLLERTPFIHKLALLLTDAVPSHSVVVALSAAWGEGKSSTLALVAERLAEESAAAVVWFDPWHYESLSDLVDALLAQLGTADVGDKGDLASAVKRARGSLRQRTMSSTASISWPVTASAQETRELPPSLADALQTVSEALERSGKRLVLICEDLDRLSHEQARRFFSLLFSIRKIDNLTVLLPIDRVEMRRVLESDAHLLDRLIEVDIPLPGIETVLVQSFVLEELAEIFKAHDFELDGSQAERAQQTYVRALHLVLTNLRKAKQWLNAVDIGLHLAGKEVDPVDFALLEAIRIFFPEAHRVLESRQALFVGGFSLQLVGMQHEEEAALRKSAVDDYLAAANSADRHALEEISGVLMPDFHSLARGEKPSSSYEILRLGRFADPANFPRYFLFRPEQRDVPLADVDALAAALEQGDDLALDRFEHFWTRHGMRGPYVFDRLLQRADGLSPQAAGRLIALISRFADRLGRESAAFQPSQADRARATVFQAANRAENPQSALAEVIEDASSLDFAAETLFFLRHRDRNLIFERWNEIDVEALRSVLRNRVEIEPINAVATAEVPARVLEEVGKEAATAFVLKSLGEDLDIETVLTWFRHTRTDESQISFDWIDRALDASALVGPAKATKGRRSLEFLQWWDARSDSTMSGDEPK